MTQDKLVIYLPTFRSNLSVPSPLIGTIGYPEKPVTNCQSTLRHISQEGRSHSHGGKSLKTPCSVHGVHDRVNCVKFSSSVALYFVRSLYRLNYPNSRETLRGERNIMCNMVPYLTFVRPCIVIYFYSKTNQMHNISNLFYFGSTIYMFRTVSPSVISSLRLYI